MTRAAPVDRSTLRLSEVARHVVVPEGIVDTLWFDVEERCREFGDTFDAWQDGLGQVTLGLDANGMWAATVGGVTYSIPRQVAKTFIVGRIVVALCTLFPNLTFLWTAHRLRTTTNTFQKLRSYVLRSQVRPYLKPGRNLGTAIRDANGEQEIPFANGSTILFGAREQGFGRGFDEVDGIVFDEAQILTEKALEDMVASTNQSRWVHGALLFYMGTPPRPIDPGEVFTERRRDALDRKSAADRGDFSEPLASGDALYVECSADPDAGQPGGPELDDPEQVERANPSYPHRTPPVAVRRLRRNLPGDEGWLREGLGVWDAAPSAGVIPAEAWAVCTDPESVPVDRFALGLEVGPDLAWASLAIAGQRDDDRWHVALEKDQYTMGRGADWVIPYIEALVEANPQFRSVVVDVAGPVKALLEKRGERWFFTGTKVRATPIRVSDLGAACSTLLAGVVTGSIAHIDQPQLSSAALSAGKRTLGDTGMWVWSRKSATSDITPIQAATLALHGAMTENVTRPTRASGRERKVVVLS